LLESPVLQAFTESRHKRYFYKPRSPVRGCREKVDDRRRSSTTAGESPPSSRQRDPVQAGSARTLAMEQKRHRRILWNEGPGPDVDADRMKRPTSRGASPNVREDPPWDRKVGCEGRCRHPCITTLQGEQKEAYDLHPTFSFITLYVPAGKQFN